MTSLLIRLFVKDWQQTENPKVRERYSYLCSGAGICGNLLLSAIKFLIGLLTRSIAITADAVNNLSDVGSSVVTLLGFKLSSKPADSDHPFGHGRGEYITGLIISFLIMLVGVEFIKSSVEKIINPEPLQFHWGAVIALLFSIAVKLWLSRLNKVVGARIHSAAITAASLDSRNDVIATSVTLISLIASCFTSLPVDGCLGVVVALFVLYSGYSVAKDTISPLLGQAPDPELIKTLEQMLMSYPPICGVHDMIIHNYGPGRIMASVHAEVPADENVLEAHDVIDLAEKSIYQKLHIPIVIHLDPVDTGNEETNRLRELMGTLVQQVHPALSIHDFRVVWGKSHSNLIFDLLVPSDQVPLTNEQLKEAIDPRLWQSYPDYYTIITFDRSYWD